MAQRLHRLRRSLRPATLLAALVCVAAPFAWEAVLPQHEGVPRAVVLGTLPAGPGARLELPGWQVEAKLVGHAAMGVGVRAELLYAFDWEEAGRYTLYGVAAFDDVAPVELSVNGEKVAAYAFARDTGSRRRFERERIATGVELLRGRNQVKVAGEWAMQRAFVLELRRETGLSPLRALAIALATAFLLALRAALVRRRPLSPGAHLTATAAFFALFVLLPPVAFALRDGAAIADLDRADRRKGERLRELELYLASELHAGTRDAWRVAVLGDSTHFWPRPRDERMLPSLRRALDERGAGDVAVYGVSAGAFSSYDFYLLLCRLVDDPPDLVIVPVNLRSFSEKWHRLRDHDFARIERYLPLSELPFAHGLTLGPRILRWDALLRVHLDAWLFDGEAGAFLRGAARRLHAERDRLLAGLAPGPALAAAPEPPDWPVVVTRDDPTLEPFRRLNALAARRGIPVLYYTVQVHEQAQAARGVDLKLREHYALIGREIGRDPGVTYLDLSSENPAWMFQDEYEHLSREGMEAVAGRLADAVLRLRARARP
ncbi:MAG: hypothetical protein ACQGVC_13010 [Myxococcota bacterium]